MPDTESDYEKVKALFPASITCGTWYPLQNGFEGMVTERGAWRVRRPVRLAGESRFEIFTLTRKGGLRSTGFARID